MVNFALISPDVADTMSLARLTSLPRRARSVLLSLVAEQADETGRTVSAYLHALHAVWKSRKDIFHFLRTGDEGLGYDLRRRFGLGATLGTAQPIPDDLFQPVETAVEALSATVVIPIFNAADHVERLLTELSRTLPDQQRVLLVNDGSKDPRIAEVIAAFERDWPHTTTLTFPHNQGFVAAVNAAVSRVPPSDHVILLNSDTLPPPNWITRLLAPLVESKDIASVTPLSNAAEILSVPCAGHAADPTPEMIAAMDGTAQRLRHRAIDLPTGIGFCIALSRPFLDLVGAFDPAFGQGYGEEVDWCQRASALGGRHVAATNLVVGHHGGASFGADARRTRIARASRVIGHRYPDYPSAVTAWERRDPIAPERLAVALAWASHQAKHQIPVYIAHSIGGGAETALQAEIAEARKAGVETVVILRVGGRAQWRVELCSTRFTLSGDVDNTEVLHDLLAPLDRRHVIYSCAVHALHPERIPDDLLQLAKGHRLSVRLHDFYPISPSWNLLDSRGQFHGIPALDTDDPVHGVAPTSTNLGCSHRDWRDRWARVIDAAEEITVFAASGGKLLSQAYPNARDKIKVRPHRPANLPPRLRPGGQTLGALGGINHAKGGTVLQALTEVSPRRIAIIGELDGRFRLGPPHIVHGRYEQDEITRLARAYDIGVWFLPSVCPETFSFATHEALATGLPVACFNLGAQGETVGDAENGHLCDMDPGDIEAIAARLDGLFTP